jgi:hypothetical protein
VTTKRTHANMGVIRCHLHCYDSAARHERERGDVLREAQRVPAPEEVDTDVNIQVERRISYCVIEAK